VNKLEKYLDQLGFTKYYKNPLFEGISAKVNQSSSIVFTAVLAILVVLLIFSSLGGAIIGFFSFFFPAYQTFKTMEQGDQKPHNKMLIFWTLYGLLNLLDKVASFFPFYTLLRTSVTIYLYMNDYQGAERLYETFLRDRIRPYVQRIGELVEKVEEKSELISKSIRKRD
jgi:hypothetical protein